MANEFDTAVAASLQPDQGQAARVGFSVAADTNPDAYAEAQRVARRTGVPVDTVLNMPKEMKRQDAVGSIDFDALAKTSPATASLLADVEKAKIAHDNVDNMSRIEDTLRPITRSVRAAVAGATFDLSSGFYGLLETGFKLVAPLGDPLAGTILPENPLRRVAAGFEDIRKNQAAMAEKVAGDQTGAGFIEQGINSGFRSFGQMAPGMAGTVMTGNPAFALGSAGALQGSQSATKALDAGKTPLQALAYGAEDATAEIATEMIPMGRLLKDLKAGAPFFKVLGHQIATEVPTELAATAWQNFNEWANLNPDKPFSTYLEALPAAEAQTILATVTTSALTAGMGKGVNSVVNRMQQKQVDAGRANQTAELLASLNQLAAADKVLQRDPQTFQEWVGKATEDSPVQQVFIDANTLMQSGVADQVAAVSPAVAQQLPEALQTGGTIAIPVDEYTARIAPTEYAQSLLDHLKTDPEGFSRAEAQQYMQSYAEELKAEVERTLAEKQGDDTFKQSAEAVRAEVKAQLDAAARFTPQVNDAYSSMVSNFFAVQAAKLGITPQEMFQRYPLKVGAERIDGGAGLVLDQGEVQRTDRIDEATGLPLNADGTVTVYHHTTAANAEKIRREGWLRSAGEPDLYFTTHAETDTGYGDTAIPVRVSPERLVLDDEFPGGRQDYRVGTPSKGRRLRFLPDGSAVLNQVKPVVATLSGEEIAPRNADTNTLRAAARTWYDNNLRGKGPVVNEASGRSVEFKKAGKAFSTSANHDKLRLFAALRDIIAKGEILASRPPVNPQTETNTKAYHWLVATVQLDGKPVQVGVTLREDNRGHLYYNHNPVETKASPASELGDTAHKAGAGTNEGEAFNQSIEPDGGNINLHLLNQGQQAARGSFNPATLSITLLKNADLSTFLHESGHFFLEVQFDVASKLEQEAEIFGPDTLKPGEAQILKDTRALLDWFGVDSLAEWYNLDFEEKRAYHEQFARGFEAYLFEGTSPSIEMQGLFQRFRAWLLNVYRDLKSLNVELTPEVRGVFDRMLATSEQIALAEQGRSMMPLFNSAQEAGMTPEEFAAYQALGVDATNTAIQDLQARGLRDMTWLHNARGRIIKQLQKEAKAQRAEVQIEVRREVMSQPIYRAWQFLTGKLTAEDKIEAPAKRTSSPNAVDETQDSLFAAIAKLGGLDRAAVQSEWGIDPKERIPMPAFGKHVLRREGGMSIDAMGEALGQYGYLTLDEHGKHDLHELEHKFFEELRGNTQHSVAYDYSADQEMRAGDQVANPEALGAARLDLGELKVMGLPAEVVNALKARRMTAATGLHPDIVAEMFGFTSGDELVRKLAEVETPKAEIDALTDVRMLEQFGELSSPEAIEKAADKAIHNDARARFVATEANALAKATGQRKVLTSAAKEFASAMIARLKVRNIKPGQYASAEVRAAKAAEKASKSGDLATAAAEKRNQLIQNYATRAAYDAQDTVDKGLRYLKKFEGDIKVLDADYADQIGNLLERFDLRKGQSNKAVDKRTALAEWIKAQREAGLEPDISTELENEAFRTSYKNLTVEEFRGLVDAVRQIEHLGRLKHKLLTAADQRAYEAVRDEIAASIHEHAQGREADTRTPTTNMGRAVQGLKRFWASHIKAATWARVMDGGKDGGPVWEYFVRNANERGDMETTLRAEATAKLSEILAPVFKLGRMGGKGQFFPSIGRSLNREARLAIALNTGNTGNLQRLLGGEGWTMAQLTPVLQSLTAQEWAAVQAVWDHFESYRPQIAAKERRVYGKEPEWVEPRPFAVTTADGTTVQMRGGYYPIKYDPAASQRAEEHADAEGAKRQLQGAYTTATTRRSFTKSRAEEVSGRPLLYTMAGLYSGVNDVIHDLAWHEWLVDTNRLLRSHTIDQAIREHYGPEAKQQFKTWAQDIAEGERGADNAIALFTGRLRQGVSLAGLGFNVMSAIMQPLGITQSITRVGAQWIGRGVLKYAAGPIDLTRQVNEMSDFMANRARTRFRELNELRNQVQDQSAAKEMVGRYAYFLMMRCQQMVDVPTWWGAYEKAIAEGNEESRAVSLADQAVIDAQGGGQTKDLSAVERADPAGIGKIFTVFYSFMNTALNIGVEKTMSADTPAKRAKLAVDYAMLYVVPAVLGCFLKAALTPGDAGDDDPEKLAKKLAANQIDYLMGLMVGVREFTEAAKVMTGADDKGRDYSGPAGVRLIPDAGTFAKQAHQGEFDDAFRKAAVNLVGDMFGLPSAQINRTLTGTQALAEGKTENPAAVAFGFQEPR